MVPKEAIQNVAVVLRVSTHGQIRDDQKDSIDDQRKTAQEWANDMGWNIVAEYDETVGGTRGQSGRTKLEDRQLIQDLLNDSKEGGIDLAIFYDNTRLARSDRDAMNLGYDLRDLDVLVGFTKERRIADIEVYGDRILFSIQNIAAQEDWSELFRKTRGGKFNGAVAGKWTVGSRPPKGYKVDRNTQSVVIDTEVARHVARVFEVVAAGASATEAGNKLGPEFRAAGVKIGVTNRTIDHTIRKTAYRGDGVDRWLAHPSSPKTHKCTKHQVPSGKSTRCSVCAKCKHPEADRNDDGRLQCPDCGRERFTYAADAIVTTEVWKKANDSLDAAALRSRPFDPGRKKLDWQQYGLGARRIVHAHDYGDAEQYTMMGTHRSEGRVYHCRASKIRQGLFTKDDPNRCRGFGTNKSNGRIMTSVRAGLIESAVLLLMLDKLTDPTVFADWVEALDRAALVEGGRDTVLVEDPATLLAALEVDLDDLDGKAGRWAEQYAEGIISKPKRDEKLASIEIERKTLVERRGRIAKRAETRQQAVTLLERIISGTVITVPSIKDVTAAEPQYDEETGLPIHEVWPWSDAAQWLAKEACDVLNGKRRDLSEDAAVWVRQLAETFDIHVEFAHGNDDGEPLWTLKGSIPLDSKPMTFTGLVGRASCQPATRNGSRPATDSPLLRS